MPIIASAKKALRRSNFLAKRNLRFKLDMKQAIKKVNKAVEQSKPVKEIEELVRDAISTIDKATRKNILHRNTAARKKAGLQKMLNNLQM